MQNINVKEEFANWLKTSNYDGPINITAKFYVKEDHVSRFCEIMKTVVEYSNTDHAALMQPSSSRNFRRFFVTQTSQVT